ncbi:NAD(P)-binding protein [Mangrovicoccus sp. HB161399]|uniref:NAD(P)-binding protein n=1 Tax=Mangrovicoccus sp. HB161399 TaxID=2720392 RepID=UPI001552D52E|nr:NAD(P)-binding protein [Mangrovicoccus sp. HB161399]
MAEILVAGAGPAGCAAAAILARQGFRVTLADPCPPVPPRIESLPAAGQRLAAELGLAPALSDAILGTAERIELAWRPDSEIRSFGHAGPLLLSRPRLHAALRRAAFAAGAELAAERIDRLEPGRAACRSGAVLVAAVILDARGRAAGGLAPLGPPRAALPFRGNARREQPSMGLAALADGWLWWAAAAGELQGLRVAAPGTLAGMDAAGRQGWLRASGHPITETCETGTPVPAGLAAADPLAVPGIIRIGDAALARDPVGAHGLVHALRSAAQGAAAAATWLRHPAERGAAEQFLRLRHRTDCTAARAATAASHAEQGRHRTAFWQEMPATPALPSSPPPGRLRLAAVAAQVPLMAGGHIQWARGMELRTDGTQLARLGPYPAAALLAALAQPGTADEFAARLARLGPSQAAAPAVAELARLGALVPA